MEYYADRHIANKNVANNPDVQRKLDEISKSEMPIAWDGCHKIYFCRTRDEIEKLKSHGYDFHLPSEIHDIWDKSCDLKFAHAGDLEDHPLDIGQFEDEPEEDEHDDEDYDDEEHV